MKFLVDRCAGRRLAEWLRQQGHDHQNPIPVTPLYCRPLRRKTEF